MTLIGLTLMTLFLLVRQENNAQSPGHTDGVSKSIPLAMVSELSSLPKVNCPSHCTCRNISDFNSIETEVICDGNGTLHSLPSTTTMLVMKQYDVNLAAFVNNLVYSAVTKNLTKNLTQLALNECNIISLENVTFSELIHLEKLDLSNNHIVSAGFFKNLNSLKILDLSQNNLKVISDDFNPNLRNLNLSFNQISNITTLGHIISLEFLDLSSNYLTKLTNDIFSSLINLQYLNLSNNKIELINSNCFNNLLRLQQLDVSHNHLTSVELQSLPNLARLTLSGNPHLGDLLIGTGRRLQAVDASQTGLEFVPPALTHSVRTLRLSSNAIHTVRCGDFDSYPLLQLLDFTDNGLELIEEDALGRLEMLTMLFLNENKLTSVPKSLPESIRILHLERNSIENLTEADFFDLVRLEVLLLNDNNINLLKKGVFDDLHSLFTLDLSGNPITVIQPGALSNVNNLEILRLAGLPLATLARDTSFPIYSLDHLISLDLTASPGLARMLLADEAALGSIKFLQELSLADAGLIHLRSDLLKFLPQLHCLKLSGNRLDCSELEWLAQWMRLQYRDEDKNVMCFSPPHLAGTLLIDLQEGYRQTEAVHSKFQQYLYVNKGRVSDKSIDSRQSSMKKTSNQIDNLTLKIPINVNKTPFKSFANYVNVEVQNKNSHPVSQNNFVNNNHEKTLQSNTVPNLTRKIGQTMSGLNSDHQVVSTDTNVKNLIISEKFNNNSVKLPNYVHKTSEQEENVHPVHSLINSLSQRKNETLRGKNVLIKNTHNGIDDQKNNERNINGNISNDMKFSPLIENISHNNTHFPPLNRNVAVSNEAKFDEMNDKVHFPSLNLSNDNMSVTPTRSENVLSENPRAYSFGFANNPLLNNIGSYSKENKSNNNELRGSVINNMSISVLTDERIIPGDFGNYSQVTSYAKNNTRMINDTLVNRKSYESNKLPSNLTLTNLDKNSTKNCKNLQKNSSNFDSNSKKTLYNKHLTERKDLPANKKSNISEINNNNLTTSEKNSEKILSISIINYNKAFNKPITFQEINEILTNNSSENQNKNTNQVNKTLISQVNYHRENNGNDDNDKNKTTVDKKIIRQESFNHCEDILKNDREGLLNDQKETQNVVSRINETEDYVIKMKNEIEDSLKNKTKKDYAKEGKATSATNSQAINIPFSEILIMKNSSSTPKINDTNLLNVSATFERNLSTDTNALNSRKTYPASKFAGDNYKDFNQNLKNFTSKKIKNETQKPSCTDSASNNSRNSTINQKMEENGNLTDSQWNDPSCYSIKILHNNTKQVSANSSKLIPPINSSVGMPLNFNHNDSAFQLSNSSLTPVTSLSLISAANASSLMKTLINKLVQRQNLFISIKDKEDILRDEGDNRRYDGDVRIRNDKFEGDGKIREEGDSNMRTLYRNRPNLHIKERNGVTAVTKKFPVFPIGNQDVIKSHNKTLLTQNQTVFSQKTNLNVQITNGIKPLETSGKNGNDVRSQVNRLINYSNVDGNNMLEEKNSEKIASLKVKKSQVNIPRKELTNFREQVQNGAKTNANLSENPTVGEGTVKENLPEKTQNLMVSSKTLKKSSNKSNKETISSNHEFQSNYTQTSRKNNTDIHASNIWKANHLNTIYNNTLSKNISKNMPDFNPKIESISNSNHNRTLIGEIKATNAEILSALEATLHLAANQDLKKSQASFDSHNHNNSSKNITEKLSTRREFLRDENFPESNLKIHAGVIITLIVGICLCVSFVIASKLRRAYRNAALFEERYNDNNLLSYSDNIEVNQLQNVTDLW